MKNLQDYKGAEAIEIWADILEPAARVMQDPKVKEAFNAKNIKAMELATYLLREHSEDIAEILLAIDETPLTGANAVVRALDLVVSIVNDPDTASFFSSLGSVDLTGFSGQPKATTTEIQDTSSDT